MSTALIIANKAEALAWIELEPPGGEYIGHRSYCGTRRDLPAATEYLLCLGDDGLWPWLKRIRLDLLAKALWPNVEFRLRLYGHPAVDALNETRLCRDLLKRVIDELHLKNIDEVWAAYSARLPVLH
jgi:hypothetical protein